MTQPDADKIYLSFDIQYNWPPGYVSFDGLGPETVTDAEKGLKYRVYAKKESDEKFYSFVEGLNPLPLNDLNDLIHKKAAEGLYLIGDIFLIEVCDRSGKVIFGSRLNAKEKWPSTAKGPTTTFTNYYTSFPSSDGEKKV